MTNKFIPTKRHQSLYCVWIKTGNPRQPLDCVWIDPEMRSFQDVSLANNESIPAAAGETESEGSKGVCRKISPKSQRIADLRARRRFSRMSRGVRSLTRLLIAIAVLLTSAWADVGGRISGVVTDPSAALAPGATTTVTHANNQSKQTALGGETMAWPQAEGFTSSKLKCLSSLSYGLPLTSTYG
jgi:hypothetical protein